MLLACAPFCGAAPLIHEMPDAVYLKDGTSLRGLIVRNTSEQVLLQDQSGETEIPKSEIVRIVDAADADPESTAADKRGDLPGWRHIVNDLRLNDAIKSLEQIPATNIDNGTLKNIPYLSFRVNEFIELNIYGDPEDPAAVEFGIYGRHSSDDRLRRKLRNFLAGFTASRDEVSALYAIPFSGGTQTAGNRRVTVTPVTAPDAYGAWWISLSNPKRLEDARLSDAEYAALTVAPTDVVAKDGRVRRGTWTMDDISQALRAGRGGDSVFRGFYRDAQGNFRAVVSPAGG